MAKQIKDVFYFLFIEYGISIWLAVVYVAIGVALFVWALSWSGGYLRWDRVVVMGVAFLSL